jgi:cytochrome c biogenesis protein CcmG, thiol:disulfide interchange protein DsbE
MIRALLVAAALTVRLQQSGAAKVGAPAPSFGGWDLDERTVVTLETMRRPPAPMLLTFGASWCAACAKGLPRLRALGVAHGVRLVLVDVEPDAAKARAFARRYGFARSAVLDKFGAIAAKYGLSIDAGDERKTSLPRTFVLDSQGLVRAIYGEEGDDLERAVEADLAPP